METQRFGSTNRRPAGGTSRRHTLVALAGGAVGLLALGSAVTQSPRLAAAPLAAEGDPHDLEHAIQQMRAATIAFINGDTAPWKGMCSQRDDATLFGGWGGHERGWEQLEPRYEWAATRFAGGEIAFEELSRFASPDLAFTVHFEHMRARLAGRDEVVPVELRVTHGYRREDTGWKLIHRHADPIVTVQATGSVVDASGTPPAP